MEVKFKIHVYIFMCIYVHIHAHTYANLYPEVQEGVRMGSGQYA